MEHVERWIDRYQQRIRWGEYLQRAAEWLAAFLFLFGAAVLLVRLALPGWWPHVLWMSLGVIPAGVGAWLLTRRQRQSRVESIAQLDKALDTGGLLMTLTERPDAEWADRLPQLELMWRAALPKWRPKRFASYLGLPLLFAVGSCLVPLREATPAPVLKNSVARQATEQLEELLQSLEDVSVLEEEEEQKLKEEIAKLAEETRQTPLTHEKWETVDALREQMRAQVESLGATVDKLEESLQALARAESGLDPQISEEQLELLKKDVAEAVEQLAKKGTFSDSTNGLDSQLQRLRKSGAFKMPKDKAEQQELLNKLREHLDQEQKELSELRKKCKACANGQCNGEGEGENEGEGQSSGSRKDGDGNPGRGGVNRGRGDAELTWGDEAEREGVRFKEVVLPQGALDDPKDEILRVERTAPTDEPAASAPRSTGREQDPTAGRATWNRRVSPKHREVVKKFFDAK